MNLNIIITETIEFVDLLSKLEEAFSVLLPYQNKKGRLIANGNFNGHEVHVIDKYDDLAPSLCDEHYTLSFTVKGAESIEFESIENSIITILTTHIIAWEKGVWAPTPTLEGPYRTIKPDGNIEMTIKKLYK